MNRAAWTDFVHKSDLPQRCDPALWKAFEVITESSHLFNLTGLTDTGMGRSTHQYIGRKDQCSAMRLVPQLLSRWLGRNVKTVCEVGFNAGHSAAIWLEGTDIEQLHSFDIMDHTCA